MELLVINYDTEQPTVSARDLHGALEIGTPFRTWIVRMIEYGFEDVRDFQRVYQKCSTLGGEQEMVDYKLSIGMAKELCMIQRTEVGKKCRQYFIEIENAWNTPEQIFARALKMADRVIQNKDRLIAEMQPKADYFDELVNRNLLTNFRDTAKELGETQRAFINFLLVNKYIYRDQQGKIKPYAEKNNGLFEVKEYASKRSSHAGLQTLITPKGRETFRLLLQKGIGGKL